MTTKNVFQDRTKYPVGYSVGADKLEWRKSLSEGVIEIWSQPASTYTGKTFELIPFFLDGERGEICPEFSTLKAAINKAEKRFCEELLATGRERILLEDIPEPVTSKRYTVTSRKGKKKYLKEKLPILGGIN